MTETIYNYPKSFCDCYDCDENTCNNIKNGIPTNMSVYDCDFDNYFKCTDEKLLQSELQPTNKEGHIHLNPQIFKLDISGEVVYIPLWHHEVNYNNNIIKIVPLLENNIFIDRDNNIHIDYKTTYDDLSFLLKN